MRETHSIISADVHIPLLPFEILCIFYLCHHRDTPLILSSLQLLRSLPHFAEIHPDFVVPLQPNSFFRLVCPAVLFSVLFPAVGMELFYIYRMWKIKQACKKYSSVVHSTKIYLCLFTLDVWVYAETNWLQKYRTDDQKCG